MTKPTLVIYRRRFTSAEEVESAWTIRNGRAEKLDSSGLSIPLLDQELLHALYQNDGLKNRGSPGTASDYRTAYRTEVASYAVGHYHPRMARPVHPDRHSVTPIGEATSVRRRPPRDEKAVAASLSQLAALKEQLARIFRTIAPEPNNLTAYGHEIRNLMLLASTEVESECKGILRANGFVAPGDRWTTQHFVKLREPLRLDAYEVTLPMYPSLDARSPFQGWDHGSPTASLPWYEAYNQVKHDREQRFADAQLTHAIDAVVACAVLLKAQYGVLSGWRDQIGEFVSFARTPEWPPAQTYLYPFADSWQAVECPFP